MLNGNAILNCQTRPNGIPSQMHSAGICDMATWNMTAMNTVRKMSMTHIPATANLQAHFPGLKAKYVARYGNAYLLPSPEAKKLMSLFHTTCMENGILDRTEACFAFMRSLQDKNEQFSLFPVP